jgi:SAM-dependent methyltransferase
VLVDFEQSVFERAKYDARDVAIPASGVEFAGAFRNYTNRGFRQRVRELVTGTNQLASRNSITMLRLLKERTSNPRLLIIGGGSLGGGVDTFYQENSAQVVSVDTYPSPYTHLTADAHCLPFESESFDGVWITAVLEHVLDPHIVVEQIHRVLRPGALVYAETPFLFPVHEGAYDFTRFTLSGHRWLFRRFDQIDAGVLAGAGSTMVWSIRYFWRAFGFGDKLAILLTAPFFWLRYLDRVMRHRPSADAALGVFFLGRKSGAVLAPKDMIAYYDA